MILIGHDAEVFIRDEAGVLTPAIGKVGGSKAFPRPVVGGALQEDNVMAELNILPAECEDEFVHNTQSVMKALLEILPDGYSIDISPSKEFLPDRLLHPRAMESGCDPDRDVYRCEENLPIVLNGNRRYCGGHIHIGLDTIDHTPWLRETIIKYCDLLLGVPATIMDDDVYRRGAYGTPGRFRVKPYGVEYRTLSNFWLKSEASMRWAYRQAYYAAFLSVEEGEITFDPDVLDAVMGDLSTAEILCTDYGISLPQVA